MFDSISIKLFCALFLILTSCFISFINLLTYISNSSYSQILIACILLFSINIKCYSIAPDSSIFSNNRKCVKFDSNGFSLNQYFFNDSSNFVNFQIYSFNKIYFSSLELPLEFNQTIYYGRDRKLIYDLSSFTLRLDPNFTSESLRSRLLNAKCNPTKYIQYNIQRDSLQFYEILRKELSDTSYQKAKTACFNKILLMQDSLENCYSADTSAYNFFRSERLKYIQDEKKYDGLFDYKKRLYETTLLQKKDSLDKLSSKIASMNYGELISESKKLDVLSKKERLITSFQKFEIGKTQLNYSKLTVQNLLIKGIDIQSNFNSLFIAGSIGRQADYYNGLFPNIYAKNNNYNIQFISLGPGQLEKNHIHVSYLGFDPPNSLISNSVLPQKGNIVSVEASKKINSFSTLLFEIANISKPNLYSETLSQSTFDTKAFSIQLRNDIKRFRSKIIAEVTQTGKGFINPVNIVFLSNDSREILLKTQTEILKGKLYFQSDNRFIKYNLSKGDASNNRSFYDLSSMLKYNLSKTFSIQSRYSKDVTHYQSIESNYQTDFISDLAAVDLFNYFSINNKPIVSLFSVSGNRNKITNVSAFNYELNYLLQENITLTSKINVNFSSLYSHKINKSINSTLNDYVISISSSLLLSKKLFFDLGIEYSKMYYQYTNISSKLSYQILKNTALTVNTVYGNLLSTSERLSKGNWKVYSSFSFTY